LQPEAGQERTKKGFTLAPLFLHKANIAASNSGRPINLSTFCEKKITSLGQRIYFSFFEPIDWRSISLVLAALPIH